MIVNKFILIFDDRLLSIIIVKESSTQITQSTFELIEKCYCQIIVVQILLAVIFKVLILDKLNLNEILKLIGIKTHHLSILKLFYLHFYLNPPWSY